MLKAVAKQRTKETRGGGAPLYVGYVPQTEEDFKDEYYGNNVIMKEAFEYYRTPRCQYPTSVNKILFTSLDKLAAFDAFMHIEAVSPTAVCFIVGEMADTQYFSKNAYDKAFAPKEFHIIKSASHIDLYDKPEYTSEVTDKLGLFFDKYLK